MTISIWDDFEVPAHARGGRVTLNLYDELSAYRPKRPGAYLRTSSDRFGLEAGVDRQQEDTEDTRRHLRWGPFAKIYKENDTSAFKKRKITRDDGTIDWVVVRPQFRRLLADLADLVGGVIDAVIFYDLDRLVRRPRDLEDLIDIVEHTQRPAVGATGGRMPHGAQVRPGPHLARRHAPSSPPPFHPGYLPRLPATTLTTEAFSTVITPDSVEDEGGEGDVADPVGLSVTCGRVRHRCLSSAAVRSPRACTCRSRVLNMRLST
ncbi:hypothetical protein GCM10010193_07920 [Kitasatospora atroaurantiaca]|uniref:Resolvase-like protein n=1 Tax=Kitasatospora atroaurantiaca TaxID=285545 RepID=A0A561EJG2_9ACTN|nr:recombinase family protein [Kitasatospora atroaurantiaca]TWE15750.1 resolvase-like protein [Kitasatospora atroaurantiaca]